MTEHSSAAREPDRYNEFGGAALDGPGSGDYPNNIVELSGGFRLSPMKDELTESAAAGEFPPRATDVINTAPLGQQFQASHTDSKE